MPRLPPHRQWGTRFDAIHDLDDSTRPGSTPNHVSDTLSDNASDNVSDDQESSFLQPDYSFQDFTPSKSGWGDTSPPSPSSNLYSHQPHATTNADFQQRPPRLTQRWNHNASVFVASLPPLHEGELMGGLRDLLDTHGNILNIKFIHDAKAAGAATCAFVQFEVQLTIMSPPIPTNTFI